MSCRRTGNSCSDWWTPERRAEAQHKAPTALIKQLKTKLQNRPDLAPTEKARPNDFRWAAGFFEADGSIGNTCLSQVNVGQKNIWPLKRMQALFGGSITPPGANPVYQWCLSGPRARGFIMSIYGELSSRRQQQARDKILSP